MPLQLFVAVAHVPSSSKWSVMLALPMIRDAYKTLAAGGMKPGMPLVGLSGISSVQTEPRPGSYQETGRCPPERGPMATLESSYS